MNIVRKLSVALVLISIGFWVGGCGKSVSGKYGGANGAMSMEFKSGGKVDVTIAGSTQTGDYTIDGDKVTVTVQGQPMVLTIKDDGSLDAGGLAGVLKKN